MSFIATALRFGYCIVCLVKVLTGTSVSFLAEFLYATATDMCPATSNGPSACASLAACFHAAAGIAAAGACTSTHVHDDGEY